ncbi:hypothetical protein IW140_002100 [Coemansia sp. RSA 1813]|nr:hypothetical protein EV178_001249 [Coemansia sp. RSA 1646]KAJ1772602.1 hypothetical protein LPJ74_001318 [Coemansia sp. RSA 1843]KAJ2091458.1 hypothetical protein IW138_001917 [Coemansia sp. RSA 986]KAJ2570674.1 hypothetical protein IW140_002100 [Coemansia sp. RSA 1813]
MTKIRANSFSIHVASDVEFSAATALQTMVLSKHYGFLVDKEVEKHAKRVVNIVAVDLHKKNVVGTIRVVDLGNRIANLSRMVTHPDYCGHGLGIKLVEYGERFIATSPGFSHCKYIKISTKPEMLDYYKDLGYLSSADATKASKIPYHSMYKRIFRGPPAYNHKL